MKKIIWILFTICIMILTSCANENGTPEIKSTESISFATQQNITKDITQLPTSYNGKGIGTATQLPKPTDTNTPEPSVTQNCLMIQPNLPKDNKFSGTIIFETYGPKVINTVAYYDFQTGKFIETIGRNNVGVSTSPDRTMFAYKNGDNKQLEIFSSDKRKVKSVTWGKYWGSIAQWLDNQQIAIVMDEPESTDSNFSKYPRAVVIVNPFTNKMQIFSPEYPNIDKASENFSWGLWGSTVYDPTLTRVIYPGSLDQGTLGASGYTLYDISRKKKIVQIPNPGWVGRPPVWSPDGSQFIMMGDDEFYLVSYDGKISKLTHLNPNFNLETRKGRSFQPAYYDWSPDGKNVAFWLEASETDRRILAILDIETGKITDTCVPSGYDPKNISTFPYPAWSPDGKSLVIAANYNQENNGYDVVVVDLETHFAYKITSNLFPVGWIVSK